MNVPWPTISLTSVAGTFALNQFAPQYSVSTSYVWTFLLLLAIQAVAAATYIVIIWPKLLSPLRDLPRPPGGSFFNGQFRRISSEPTGIPHRDWINNVPHDGLLYYTSLFNEERLLIASPQALGEVLTTKSYDFVKPILMRNGLGRILGNGLLLAEGDEHKRQRKSVMPAFAYRHIKDLYPVFWGKSVQLAKALTNVTRIEGKALLDKLADAPVVEIAGWSSRATLDIIGTAGMGQDFNALDDPDNELNATYRRAFQPNRQQQILAFAGLLLPQWFLRSLPVAHNENVVQASGYIRKVCSQLIRQKQEKMNCAEKRLEVDILSVALESGGFSEEDLVDQMMTFLAAGHETTATSMTWAFCILSQHPNMQTRLREEIRSHLPPIDSTTETVTAAMLDQCHYLHAVCNEVLRVFAPVPMTLRVADCDTSIIGHPVPRGTVIILPVAGVNVSKELWGPDAADFDPERWLGAGRANTGGAESNYAMLTFLHGPRSCIGQAFAKAEFACLLAAVIGRFEIELEDPEYPAKMLVKGGITSKPKDGLKVRMRALDGW